jgi:hypothetical protein
MFVVSLLYRTLNGAFLPPLPEEALADAVEGARLWCAANAAAVLVLRK